jgi:RNA polymerase sigma-70 factor (family 1)
MQSLLLLEYNQSQFVSALRDGDEVVYELVFKDYYNSLCNYAHSIVEDLDEAEEMVQNTFLTLWENRLEINIHTSVKSYLYQAVHNNCLNRLKHEKVRQAYGKYKQQTADDLYDSVSQQLISKELQLQIKDAIEALPDQCRRVFELSRFEYLTYAEIAEQLGISIKTVEKHMIKALKHMREHLKDYLPILLLLMTYKN